MFTVVKVAPLDVGFSARVDQLESKRVPVKETETREGEKEVYTGCIDTPIYIHTRGATLVALVVSSSDLPLRGVSFPPRGVGYPHRSLQRRA